MEGDEDVEEGGASMDLSAARIVCPKKYDETESCGVRDVGKNALDDHRVLTASTATNERSRGR